MTCLILGKRVKNTVHMRTTCNSSRKKLNILKSRFSQDEKTAALNLEKDGNKLWRLTKQFNDEDTRRQSVTLEEYGEMIMGK